MSESVVVSTFVLFSRHEGRIHLLEGFGKYHTDGCFLRSHQPSDDLSGGPAVRGGTPSPFHLCFSSLQTYPLRVNSQKQRSYPPKSVIETPRAWPPSGSAEGKRGADLSGSVHSIENDRKAVTYHYSSSSAYERVEINSLSSPARSGCAHRPRLPS